MTKTVVQIKEEMEAVILIKEALELEGWDAYEMLKSWTTNKEELSENKESSHETDSDNSTKELVDLLANELKKIGIVIK